MAESNIINDDPSGFHGVGLEYHTRFQQWWSRARLSEEPPSPTEFLLNFGAHPTRTRSICRELIEDSYGMSGVRGPGAIHYFTTFCTGTPGDERGADHLEDALEQALSVDPSTDQPTERDLLALADASTPSSWDNVLSRCMVSRHSAHFLLSMVDKIPKNVVLDAGSPIFAYCTGNRERRQLLSLSAHGLSLDPIWSKLGSTGYRWQLDHASVGMIQKALPQLSSFALGMKWDRTAFVDCLALLCQSKRLKCLVIRIPECSGEDPTSLSLAVPTANECGIEQLLIDTVKSTHRNEDASAPFKPWLRAGRLAWDCIRCLPQLRELRLFCCSLPELDVRECLVTALQSSTCKVKKLSITTTLFNETPIKIALLGILGALKSNTSLRKLDYTQMYGDARFAPAVYAKKVLEILQSDNTTLTDVSIACDELRTGLDDTSQWPKIEYYLKLNGEGRQKARDPKTTAAEFFGLLHISAQQQNNNNLLLEGFYRAPAVNINYGLLRELPGAWVTHALLGGLGSRKRKRAGKK